MISIIITSYKEPETIGKAIESIISQKISEDYELLVTAPDKETLLVAKENSKKNKKVRLFQDPGKGKSYAINLLMKKIQGRIALLTDGDVYLAENSINPIIKMFEDKEIGCVTGRPVPVEDKNSKYGYWANFLFDSAHKLRKERYNQKSFLECSGYLWAFRTGVINSFPLDVAEDTIVPYLFWEKGYKIGYSKESKVYVKNVSNWKEWISQKKRTSKAHETLGKYVDTKKTPRMKSFSNEFLGLISLFSYPKSFKEFFWSIELSFARLYTWICVFKEVYIIKKYHEDKWERVESSK